MKQFLLSDDRTFVGVANSGKPFSYYGQRAIVDLSDVSFAQTTPALLLHDREQRVGFGALAVENNQLIMNGTLLDNEHATQIIKEADAGFPWQLSAHVKAGQTLELTGETVAVVNGQTVHAPILILKHCYIAEVSFTPTGVDTDTSAVILSDDYTAKHPNINQTPQGNTTMTDTAKDLELSELKQQIATLTQQNADKQTKIDELTAQHKTASVEAKLSAKGFKKTADGWDGVDKATVDILLSLDSDKADTMINALSAPKSTAPEFLLGEQYTDGQAAGGSAVNPLLADAKARK